MTSNRREYRLKTSALAITERIDDATTGQQAKFYCGGDSTIRVFFDTGAKIRESFDVSGWASCSLYIKAMGEGNKPPRPETGTVFPAPISAVTPCSWDAYVAGAAGHVSFDIPGDIFSLEPGVYWLALWVVATDGNTFCASAGRATFLQDGVGTTTFQGEPLPNDAVDFSRITNFPPSVTLGGPPGADGEDGTSATLVIAPGIYVSPDDTTTPPVEELPGSTGLHRIYRINSKQGIQGPPGSSSGGGGGSVTVPDATTAEKGIARFATQAETLAGTSSALAVTPSGLAAKLAASGGGTTPPPSGGGGETGNPYPAYLRNLAMNIVEYITQSPQGAETLVDLIVEGDWSWLPIGSVLKIKNITAADEEILDTPQISPIELTLVSTNHDVTNDSVFHWENVTKIQVLIAHYEGVQFLVSGTPLKVVKLGCPCDGTNGGGNGGNGGEGEGGNGGGDGSSSCSILGGVNDPLCCWDDNANTWKCINKEKKIPLQYDLSPDSMNGLYYNTAYFSLAGNLSFSLSQNGSNLFLQTFGLYDYSTSTQRHAKLQWRNINYPSERGDILLDESITSTVGNNSLAPLDIDIDIVIYEYLNPHKILFAVKLQFRHFPSNSGEGETIDMLTGEMQRFNN